MNAEQPCGEIRNDEITETAPSCEAGTHEYFATKPDRPGEAALRQAAVCAGQTFGDYDLLDKLGEGGMGVVFRARQRSANRMVALKLIRPECLALLSPQSRARTQRFVNEAQAAARLAQSARNQCVPINVAMPNAHDGGPFATGADSLLANWTVHLRHSFKLTADS